MAWFKVGLSAELDVVSSNTVMGATNKLSSPIADVTPV